MKKFLIIISMLLIAISTNLMANKIVMYEYWFDSDYTHKSTFEDETNGYTGLNDEISVADLSVGIHKFNLRFKDSDGLWSTVLTKIFIKSSNSNGNLSDNKTKDYEFWFDNDYANKSIGETSCDLAFVLDEARDVSKLTLGIHKYNLRFRDAQGLWSTILTKMFIKQNESYQNISENKITSYRYWFENETNKIKTVHLKEPAVLADIIFDAKPYYRYKSFNMQIIDSLGQTTPVITHPFEVSFSYIMFGRAVSFQLDPRSRETFKWDFGDGETDTVPNPKHIYKLGGVYQVKLTVTDSTGVPAYLSREVQVKGVQNLSTYKGGNTGNVTLYIYGAEFNNKCKVWFGGDNDEKISPDTLVYINSNILVARFDLRDKSIGKRDFAIEFPGDTTMIVEDWFTIEEGIEPKLQSKFIGNTVIRPGSPQQYSIVVKNDGNIDAYGVPVFIAIEGDPNVTPKFIYDGKSCTFDRFQDKDKKVSTYSILIPSLNSNESATIDLSVQANNQSITVSTSVSTQLIDNLKAKMWTDGVSCLSGAASCALNFIPGINLDQECLMDNAISLIEATLIGELSNDLSQNNYKDIGELLAKSTVTCLLQQGLEDAAEYFLKKAGGPAVSILFCLWDMRTCPSFIRDIWAYNQITVVTSRDPNEIYGPKSTLYNNYIQGSNDFPYRISFENVDSATAPAQEVIINNIIDKTKFDISTFQLGSISFGDTIINVPLGLSEYTVDVDLRKSRGLDLRIDAKLDTASGRAMWHFISLDTNTRKFTDDPYAGFLPPNVTAPEGEGSVSYSIKPLANLENGTELKNKASIVFDLNEAILTNEWLNTIDNDKPTSSVETLDSLQDSLSFWVNWSGTDGTSAIEYYNVYYSVNDGEYQMWQYRTDTTAAKFTGMVDSTYNFYCVGIDYAGNMESDKNTSESATTIDKIPVPPILRTPSNEATNIETYGNLNWTSIAFATSYRIQVSHLPDFTSPIVNSVVSDTFMILSNLSTHTTYFWRVLAMNTTDTSDWSSVWSFTTKRLEPPTLKTPSNEATKIETNPTLYWNASENALSYQLQVCLESNFITILENVELTTTSILLSTLSNNTQYYWRVLAINTSDTSDWSSIWSFTTKRLESPTLNVPLNEATSIVTNPTLNWNTSVNAKYYRVQVSLLQNVSSTVENSKTSSTFMNLYELNINTKYYWQVKAYNDSDSSNWSSIWSFVTNSTNVLENKLKSISLFPNPTKNKIELQINFSELTPADIKVYNLQGNVLMNVFAGNLPQGETKLQINCESLSNGTYNVVVEMKDKSITKRFVVAR